jgi:hypothetical protein
MVVAAKAVSPCAKSVSQKGVSADIIHHSVGYLNYTLNIVIGGYKQLSVDSILAVG